MQNSDALARTKRINRTMVTVMWVVLVIQILFTVFVVSSKQRVFLTVDIPLAVLTIVLTSLYVSGRGTRQNSTDNDGGSWFHQFYFCLCIWRP